MEFKSTQAQSSAPVDPDAIPNMESYLNRLYLESRRALYRILLGDAKPEPDTFKAIKVEIENDEHLESCRKRIGENFPGRLARMFNLAGPDDELFPIEKLRQSIRAHIERHENDPAAERLDDTDFQAIEELKKTSKLQQQLAYLANYTPGKWLLEQEIPVVLKSRGRRLGSEAVSPAPAPENSARCDDRNPALRESDSYAWSRDVGRLRGLCLSGGGIRSATFNLGVLQGLAKKNILRRFDYCSSVSGGGYIHQWLAAWIKREEPNPPATSGSPGLDAVCRHLIPLPDNGCTAHHPEPIRWLRRYSNYLTPQKGLLSADFWVTVAIWIRNTFLNQLVLISGLFSLLLLPHVFQIQASLLPHDFHLKKYSTFLTKIGAAHPAPVAPEFSLLSVKILILLGLSVSYLLPVFNLASGLNTARKVWRRTKRITNLDLCLSVVLPFLIASIVISDFGFYFALPGLTQRQQAIALCAFTFCGVMVLNFAITWAGGALSARSRSGHTPIVIRAIGFFFASTLAASVCAGCIFLARNAFVTGSPFEPSIHQSVLEASASVKPKISLQVNSDGSEQMNLALQLTHPPGAVARPHARGYQEIGLQWRSVITLGPFIVMLISFIGVILHCGLVGDFFEDWVLEWLGRVRAWVTMYSLAWTGLVGIALFGHQIVHMLVNGSHNWIKWPALGGWLLTTAGSVLAGKSTSSSGDPNSQQTPLIARIVTAAGPSVYIFGLVLILSWAAAKALYWAEGFGLPVLVIVVVVPIVLFLLFGWRVDVNQFSMHSYYRNRLARCYLGASNTARNPDPLTGFDIGDVEGMQVSNFRPEKGYTGPLPIFCATLNISVGEDLAWQERKAASFAFSPVLSGYYVPWTGSHYLGQLSYNGFVPTERFGGNNRGIHISTAAAISGAAISPNWGYHTNPAMAFLLTMFNFRLGWWMENPRRSYLAFDPAGPIPSKYLYPAPRFAPAQLVQELLGRIGDDRKFVYLTDGGHFDNMGLYELVRRRCYEIVICDAEEDEGPVFEGIGMAIRKCRIDFGVEIELDLNKLARDATTKLSKVHWITGWIKYPETGNAEPGSILYIKSSITGNEAADVYNYRLQHDPFPQDSTMDQWFSESQFESYRRLGQQVVDECPFLA